MTWRAPSDAPIALDATLGSGQVFHWKKDVEGIWHGLVGDVPLRVRERGGRLLAEPGRGGLARRYFSLDHPLEEIYARFPVDRASIEALEMCRGLRMIRQPRWECLATFITSSMKKVAHIRAMSTALRLKYGTPVAGSDIRAYPSPEALAAASEQGIRECGLGYRSGNLLLTARRIADGLTDLDALAALPTPDLRRALEGLPGVGVKVANCALLFAYERLDAVPIDVWIRRVLLTMRNGRSGTPSQFARYARLRLGPYAGYVQQYLFHRARTGL